jgi:hypothetical protein
VLAKGFIYENEKDLADDQRLALGGGATVLRLLPKPQSETKP